MNQVNKVITDRIVASLKEGNIAWRKPWTEAGMPRNFVTKKAYRGINTFMLLSQDYKSPFWMTFKQMAERGGHLKDDQHGTPVIFWSPFTWHKVALPIKGKPVEEPEEESSVVLRYYRVFNLDQMTGIKLPVEEVAKPFNPIEEAEALWNGYPSKPLLQYGGDKAFYRPSDDTITLPRKEAFKSEPEYYSTLLHEATHSTGAKKRLDRFGHGTYDHSFGSQDYSKEELVAEMGSAFLCAKAGISQPVLENQEAYIKGWLKALENDARLVISAGSKAQKAYDHILGIM